MFINIAPHVYPIMIFKVINLENYKLSSSKLLQYNTLGDLLNQDIILIQVDYHASSFIATLQ